MRYFTPELIERFGSSDPATADAANAEWEEAGERYERYLALVNALLPEGIRQLHANYYLHDAIIYGMGRQDSRFVIVIRLDPPPQDFLILTYELSAGPEIEPDTLHGEFRCTTQVEWMYDEVEAVAGEPFLHSILLSNGWEVRLRFSNLQVQAMRPILALCGSGSPAPPASLPQSA